MKEFMKSQKEARTQLDQDTETSLKTRATTISQVKGKLNTFQRYRAVLQNKAALIKKLWWRSVTCTAESDVVRLIQDFDLLSADCERLEKEAADKVAIGVARAAAQNASVPSSHSSGGVARNNDSSSVLRDGGAANAPPRIQELEGKVVVGREEAAGLTSCHG